MEVHDNRITLEFDTLYRDQYCRFRTYICNSRILGSGSCIENMHLQKSYIRYVEGWPKLNMSLVVPS